MTWFRNLGVSVKILTGFGLMAVVLVAIGWVSLHNLGVLNDNVKMLYEDEMQPSLEVADLRALLWELRSNIHEEAFVKAGARRVRAFPNIHSASPTAAGRHET
jgi:methyl-accepting chemotaxis protein